MRAFLRSILLLLASFAASGCAAPGSGAGNALPAADPGIRGIVTRVQKIEPANTARVATILIEENPNETAGSAKDQVTLEQGTRIFRQQGARLTPAAADDLRVGQRVAAWYSGPVAESYPRQATASVIAIIE